MELIIEVIQRLMNEGKREEADKVLTDYGEYMKRLGAEGERNCKPVPQLTPVEPPKGTQ